MITHLHFKKSLQQIPRNKYFFMMNCRRHQLDEYWTKNKSLAEGGFMMQNHFWNEGDEYLQLQLLKQLKHATDPSVYLLELKVRRFPEINLFRANYKSFQCRFHKRANHCMKQENIRNKDDIFMASTIWLPWMFKL